MQVALENVCLRASGNSAPAVPIMPYNTPLQRSHRRNLREFIAKMSEQGHYAGYGQGMTISRVTDVLA